MNGPSDIALAALLRVQAIRGLFLRHSAYGKPTTILGGLRHSALCKEYNNVRSATAPRVPIASLIVTDPAKYATFFYRYPNLTTTVHASAPPHRSCLLIAALGRYSARHHVAERSCRCCISIIQRSLLYTPDDVDMLVRY